MGRPVFKRAIAFSKTPVTLPALTPEEHHENFVQQARALGIWTTHADGAARSASSIAADMLNAPIDRIRDLAWERWLTTTSPPRIGRLPDHHYNNLRWLHLISYNMLARDSSRANHAAAFLRIAEDVLAPLLQESARICLFESDIGFFAAALATAEASFVPKMYVHVFDLGNPFLGPVGEKGAFATHTFDVVTLLGGVHEHVLPERYGPVVRAWRDVLEFVGVGKSPCAELSTRDGGGGRKGVVVNREGVREVDEEGWLGSDGGRRGRLFELARDVKSDEGRDVLWVEVCRRFLMKGESERSVM
ncbi:hypothetical protein P171DRAFT_484540 [Karstenula rhodostoma CBS 690.94]|uniref:Uncharacterized protein n=1 Tax=Karstenula rhodostoma CBS 690.94 TaxID=1392251 RepID=A0A9P4PN68_9PLEO|nr:hypothetical protein P171DRAFT_484540 [Karstenula rhodostoma CBS 690.94]